MQPILLLVIAGVAVGALGTGFLTNDIDLSMVQQFGVGEKTIESPVDNAYIDFKIEKILGVGTDIDNQQINVFKNAITECEIQANDVIVKDSTIICKLTDLNNNVIAEGDKVLTTVLPANTPTVVEIDDPTLAALVTNVHDVILVVQGPGSVNP